MHVCMTHHICCGFTSVFQMFLTHKNVNYIEGPASKNSFIFVIRYLFIELHEIIIIFNLNYYPIVLWSW